MTARATRRYHFLLRAGTLAFCLGALSACGLKFGDPLYDSYRKPGASQEQTKAAINQCRNQVSQTGGGAVNRSAYAAGDRLESCLRRRGFAKRRRLNPTGR